MPDDLITKLEDIPLSGNDLLDICDKMGEPNLKWILYNDLKGINIDNLFTDNHSIFILLQIQSQQGGVGHWVCLTKQEDQYVYYDPYGLSIEEDLLVTHEPGYIVDLLRGRSIDVNHFQHQSFKHETQVCGRHCCLRAVFHNLANNQYNHDIIQPMITSKQVKDGDTMISLITGFLSQSDEVVKKILDVELPQRRRVKETVHRPSSLGGRII